MSGHEAWHAVQQKQGRVQPTAYVGETPINDDRSLESEADSMGAALKAKSPSQVSLYFRPAYSPSILGRGPGIHIAPPLT